MAPTDLKNLRVPRNLIEALHKGSRSSVLGQPIPVDFGWWNERIDRYRLPGGPIGSYDGHALTRTEVFAGQGEPYRLLWLSMAWGAGNRRRLCERRLESAASLGSKTTDVLVASAEQVRNDPVRAYELMAPNGVPAIPYLGPAFFTKYLYFASGTPKQRPAALILDSRVATSLQHLGWTSLGTTGGWPTTTYGRYLELINRWSQEANEEIDRKTITDEIEYWLFSQHWPPRPRS